MQQTQTQRVRTQRQVEEEQHEEAAYVAPDTSAADEVIADADAILAEHESEQSAADAWLSRQHEARTPIDELSETELNALIGQGTVVWVGGCASGHWAYAD